MIRTVTQEVANAPTPQPLSLTGSGRLNAVVGRFPLADGAVQLNIKWHMILLYDTANLAIGKREITWFSPLVM